MLVFVVFFGSHEFIMFMIYGNTNTDNYQMFYEILVESVSVLTRKANTKAASEGETI